MKFPFRAIIRSVHRIEHSRLWHRYQARVAQMRQDHASYDIWVTSAELDLDGSLVFLSFICLYSWEIQQAHNWNSHNSQDMRNIKYTWRYTIPVSLCSFTHSKAVTISWLGPNRPLTVASHLRWMLMRRFCCMEPPGIMQTPSSAEGSTTEPASMLCMVQGCISHVPLVRATSTHASSTSVAAAARVRER